MNRTENSKSVKENELKSPLAAIPGSLISQLQSFDVSNNKLFKSLMREE